MLFTVIHTRTTTAAVVDWGFGGVGGLVLLHVGIICTLFGENLFLCTPLFLSVQCKDKCAYMVLNVECRGLSGQTQY